MKIKGKRSYVLYLDQFASSELFRIKRSREWDKLLNLIETLVHKQNEVICPIPIEHFLETSARSYENAVLQNNAFAQLSKGYCFKTEVEITSQLIISLLRKNNITLSTFLREGFDSSGFNEKNNYDQLAKKNDMHGDMINYGHADLNTLRKAAHNPKISQNDIEMMAGVTKQITLNNFLNRLHFLYKNKYIRVGGDDTVHGKIPNWIDSIIHRLTEKHRIGEKETLRLISHFKKYSFDHIPTLDIRTSLRGFIAATNKGENPADGIDIMRIATGLPISDYFITDKRRKFEIKTLGLDKKYNTRVYSGTKEDLKQITSHLELLIK